MPAVGVDSSGSFELLDCTRLRQIQEVVRRHDIGTIYHLASLLSAVAEEKPQVAWDVNMGGLYRVRFVPIWMNTAPNKVHTASQTSHVPTKPYAITHPTHTGTTAAGKVFGRAARIYDFIGCRNKTHKPPHLRAKNR